MKIDITNEIMVQIDAWGSTKDRKTGRRTTMHPRKAEFCTQKKDGFSLDSGVSHLLTTKRKVVMVQIRVHRRVTSSTYPD
jgi:hypothetical protein